MFLFPLKLLLLADLIMAFFFFNKENDVFLPQLCLLHSLEHYCAMAELFTAQQYFHSASVVFSSKFCGEEFYTSEKPVGRGSGQTERAVKPDTK